MATILFEIVAIGVLENYSNFRNARRYSIGGDTVQSAEPLADSHWCSETHICCDFSNRSVAIFEKLARFIDTPAYGRLVWGTAYFGEENSEAGSFRHARLTSKIAKRKCSCRVLHH